MGIEPTEARVALSLPTLGTAAKAPGPTRRSHWRWVLHRSCASVLSAPGDQAPTFEMVELEGVEPVRFLRPKQAPHQRGYSSMKLACARQESNPHLSD